MSEPKEGGIRHDLENCIIMKCKTVFFSEWYYYGDIKEVETGRECSTHGSDEKWRHEITWKTWAVRRTILKCIVHKQYLTAWNGFDVGQEPLAQANDSLSSIKGEEFLDHAINYQVPRKESAKSSSLITLS
jgi:hypothetical protein